MLQYVIQLLDGYVRAQLHINWPLEHKAKPLEFRKFSPRNRKEPVTDHRINCTALHSANIPNYSLTTCSYIYVFSVLKVSMVQSFIFNPKLCNCSRLSTLTSADNSIMSPATTIQINTQVGNTHKNEQDQILELNLLLSSKV